MLLLCTLAFAAPVAAVLESEPVGSFGVTFQATTLRDHLTEVGCTEGQCKALSVDNRIGGALEYRPLSFLSLYAQVDNSEQKLRAASFAGGGWGVGGGLKLGAPLNSLLGLDGWAGFTTLTTGDVSNGDTRQMSQVDAGLVLRYGSVEDGLVLWGGAQVVPWAPDRPTVLGGTLPLELGPEFPLSATGGVQFMSQPLGPAWTEKGRIGFNANFVLGNQIGAGMGLTASY